MNKHTPLNGIFKKAGKKTSAADPERAKTPKAESMRLQILANIDLLLEGLSGYDTEDQINTPEAEADIRQKFEMFLIGCDYQQARFDFAQLLQEKSGEHHKRNDGTISWYHEIIPIINILALTKLEHERGGLQLDDLRREGGLQAVICTIINHDRIEDTATDLKHFYEGRISMIREYIAKLKKEDPESFVPGFFQRQRAIAKLVTNNVRLMTKKMTLFSDDGQPVYDAHGELETVYLFPTTADYIHNMVDHKEANPIPFIGKQLDVTLNTATELGCDKFDKYKRLSKCNEREDMYGSREAVSDKAMRKWPAFAKIIQKVDNLMGAVLYTEFAWLRYADLAYKDGRYKPGDTIRPVEGLHRYLENALDWPVPRAFSIYHTSLDRKRKIAQHNLQAAETLEKAVYPILAQYAQHFPEIFKKPSASANSITFKYPLPINVPG